MSTNEIDTTPLPGRIEHGVTACMKNATCAMGEFGDALCRAKGCPPMAGDKGNYSLGMPMPQENFLYRVENGVWVRKGN